LAIFESAVHVNVEHAAFAVQQVASSGIVAHAAPAHFNVALSAWSSVLAVGQVYVLHSALASQQVASSGLVRQPVLVLPAQYSSATFAFGTCVAAVQVSVEQAAF
jgi:hypothetical protein